MRHRPSESEVVLRDQEEIDAERHDRDVQLFFQTLDPLPEFSIPHSSAELENPVYSGSLKEKSFVGWAKRLAILTRQGELWVFKKASDPGVLIPIRDKKFWTSNIRNSADLVVTLEGASATTPIRLRISDEKWLFYFRKVGAHRMTDYAMYARFCEDEDPGGTDIRSVDVSKWSVAMVTEWLEHFLPKGAVEIYRESDLNWNGNDLIGLQDEDFLDGWERLGLVDVDPKLLLDALHFVLRFRVYDPFHRFWLVKFRRTLLEEKEAEEEEGEVETDYSLEKWRFHSRCLCDPECMLETYLRLGSRDHSWSSFIPEKRDPVPPSNVDTGLIGDGDGAWNSGVEFGARREFFRREGRGARSQRPSAEEIAAIPDVDQCRFRVKILLLETGGKWNAETYLRPVQNRLSILRPDDAEGIDHCQLAVIFGGWLLLWHEEASLCVPWRLAKESLGWILYEENVARTEAIEFESASEGLAKLAHFLCRLNREEHQSVLSSYQFVQDLLWMFGKPITRNSVLWRRLEHLKQYEEPLIIRPSSDFRDKFQLDSEEFRFRTHCQLDEFLHRLYKACPALMMDVVFSIELFVLFLYDILFWIRFYEADDCDHFHPALDGCGVSRKLDLAPKAAFRRMSDYTSAGFETRVGLSVSILYIRWKQDTTRFAPSSLRRRKSNRRSGMLFRSTISRVSVAVSHTGGLRRGVADHGSKRALVKIYGVAEPTQPRSRLETLVDELRAQLRTVVTLKKESVQVDAARYLVIEVDSSIIGVLLHASPVRVEGGVLLSLRKEIPIHLLGRDRFTIAKGDEARLGTGAHAVVRKGRFEYRPGKFRPVAVKKCMCTDSIAAREEEVEKMMFRLAHDNVLKCFGCFFDEDDDVFYKILELCERDLRSYLDESVRNQMSRWTADVSRKPKLDILLQISRGIRHLHEHGIVHRDLKPSNILISSSSRKIKICDFDLSRNQASISARNTGGTPCYMPNPSIPIQAGEAEKIDVYAFGILAWEVWTGKVPYESERAQFTDATDLLAHIHSQALRPNSTLIAEVEVRDLCVACWHESPRQRPHINEIVATLEEIKRRV